jgi:hypothetical protein
MYEQIQRIMDEYSSIEDNSEDHDSEDEWTLNHTSLTWLWTWC